MKRKRYETPGEVRFLTFSCDRRKALLASESARELFVDQLALTRDRLGFRLYAYVVMPNHVHLLLLPDVEVATVRRILSALKSRSAARVLDLLRRERPIQRPWQPGGGYDRNIHSNREFHEKLDYIEGNPVAAGLVERAEDYRWSSAHPNGLGRDPW